MSARYRHLEQKAWDVFWDRNLVCTLYASSEGEAVHKARDYLNNTGRLYNISRVMVAREGELQSICA